MVRVPRSAGAALVALAVVVAPGCTPGTGGEQPTAVPSASGAPAGPATPAPTVTVTTPPAPPAPVLLTDQGVGDVVLGSAGAYDRLVTVLGEPTEPVAESCSFWYVSWGGLTVYLDDPAGAATGWYLGGGPLADQVQPPYGVYPGDPVRLVLDEGGVIEPTYSFDSDEIAEYRTTVGAYSWYSATDDPDSPVSSVSVESPGCD
ncbi:hypothetical protein [Actinotalea solisilvae]|uniref:hypothetical protein n=1 Tax=Actinotalea solisilvae TaxID=2072922 RepID=UPI0018F12A4E|nr:hypothetical protein [Actinotalea solisilvae]